MPKICREEEINNAHLKNNTPPTNHQHRPPPKKEKRKTSVCLLGLGECISLRELCLGNPGTVVKQEISFGKAPSNLQNVDSFQHEIFVYPITSVISPKLLIVTSCKAMGLKIRSLSQ